MRVGKFQVGVLSLVAVLLLSAVADCKEGFGTSKLAVQLGRVHPPDVYITGIEIAVRSSGQGEGGAIEQQLIASLESELLGNDPRLKLETERPQTVVEVAVLDSQVNERWETRTESQTVKTGTDSKGKAQYSSRNVSVRYKVVTQVFSVAYKVRDLGTGATLHADNIAWNFKEDYREGGNAPDKAQLEYNATMSVVRDIAGRLTPTTETIGVLIPKGSLSDLGNLAKSGLWNRYLEALESMPPKAKPEDESYRQYALGVAYEALGYGAEEPEICLSYLEQAAMHYDAAISANPKQKYFTSGFKGSGFLSTLKSTITGSTVARKEAMAPVERVRTALGQYQKVMDFQASQAEAQMASLDGAKGALGDGGSNVITNASVIEMAQAGLPEEIILTTLDSAPATEFDASPKGLIELAEAKVSTKIIQRIQALASGKGGGTR